MKKLALALLVTGASLMAADGAALFQKCAGCHGAKGEKPALGKSAIIGGQAAADLEASLKAYKAGTRNVTGAGGMMKAQVGSYSDADIATVAAYVSGLK